MSTVEGATPTPEPEGATTTPEPEVGTTTPEPEGATTTPEPEGGTPTPEPAGGTTTPEAAGGPSGADVPRIELDLLVGGAHHDPHSILGMHPAPDGQVVRTLRPDATKVVVVTERGLTELTRVHEGGVFAAVLPGVTQKIDYQLEVMYGTETHLVDDPYRWLPTFREMDQHLFGEGRHERLWDVLGAHEHSYPTLHGTVWGTSFAVWAPNARGVRVTGDFDHWEHRTYPMRSMGGSGVWELFIPGVRSGTRYRYAILGADSVWRDKADPMAFAAEQSPGTASIVYTSSYDWKDADWLEHRARTTWHKEPMSIYEVHVGSWRSGLGYRQLADELVDYLVDTGFTHVELLPVAEHPYGGSWGYQVTSYYAPASRWGTPDDFRYLVDRMHAAGVGVIVDWVPAHFPKDEWALARFDGAPLYEHADPRRGEHPDWGTLVFDFGRNEVRNFLVANALYWLTEFHVDGLRVDAVASMLYLDYSREPGDWLPNQYGGRENLDAVRFLQEMNATVYRTVPGAVTVAEESTAWPGVTRPTHLLGLGFGFKWNMGWMHDTLDYCSREPIYRSYHHQQLTFSMMYAYSENFVLPLSHDEVVHGKGSLIRKMPGDRWQKLATLRTLFAYMWAHPGKQLLFMGGEFAQESEWSDSRGLDWWLLDNPDNRGVHRLVSDLNRVYRDCRAMWSADYSPDGFHWIDANDAANNVFSFLRYGDDGSAMACVANFSGVPHEGYRLGLPRPGDWEEAINTDADVYFGSGVGNLGRVRAVEGSWHGQPHSAVLRIPPLGALWLRHRG